MKMSVRHFRNSVKAVFDAVQQGEDVVVYSHKQPLVKITQVETNTKQLFKNIGFGMWRDDVNMQNVAAYARKLRRGRQHDR